MQTAIIGKSLLLELFMKSITVFCGASDEVDQTYLDIAYKMGLAIADRGMRMVYGGGGTGLMGAVADGALSVGGHVTGIIPEFFNTVEKAHDNLSRIEVVVNMHERKARMAELVEGFIALPGGFGTLEELFEVLTWSQIGLHNKPIGLLNAHQFFDSLLDFLKQVKDKKFTTSNLDTLYSVAASPNELLETMIHFHQQNIEKQ